ncbi:MAG: peptide chain release factor 2 [Christensenellaceae bacterium]|nr:peptide chain release factor 2 [Christensenellaceae bacterium]
MTDIYELRQQLETITQSINTSAKAINITKLEAELNTIKSNQVDPDYWKNLTQVQTDNQRIASIERRLDIVRTLIVKSDELRELLDLTGDANDDSLVSEITIDLQNLSNSAHDLFLETLFTGKYDSLNAILSLHSGAGGTEAQDWVDMLYRMYVRFCENAGFKVSVIDYLPGDSAGTKSITFVCSGANAYGLLKAEMGVHRLVRISPFDANKRRHTSFASLEVMPEIIGDSDIKIEADDLRIDTLRSSGAGGQHVNKTESAVRITHIPTGIVVCCQNERSQIQNKETAMRLLKGKLIEKKERERIEMNLNLRGDIKKIEWGSQIRSYVFCPYTLVKDHRTNHENSNINAIMDGDLSEFIYSYLTKISAVYDA